MSYNEFIKPFILEYLDGANIKIRFSTKNNQPKHFDPINSLGGFTLPVIPKPTKVEIIASHNTHPFRLWLCVNGNVRVLNRACQESEMELQGDDEFVRWIEEKRVAWVESPVKVWEELDGE